MCIILLDVIFVADHDSIYTVKVTVAVGKVVDAADGTDQVRVSVLLLQHHVSVNWETFVFLLHS